jgi:hypothetical protein
MDEGTAVAQQPVEEGIRSAAVFLTHVADGTCHADLSRELRDLGMRLVEEAQRRDAKVKGELVLKLSFTTSPGVAGVTEVAYDIKVKVPPAKRPTGTMWITRAGNFSQENPRQTVLPLREVGGGPAPVRDLSAART